MILDTNDVPLGEGLDVRITGFGWKVRTDHVGMTGKTEHMVRGGGSWDVRLTNGELVRCKNSQIIRSFPNPEVAMFNFWGKIPLLKAQEEGLQFKKWQMAELSQIIKKLNHEGVKGIEYLPMFEFSNDVLRRPRDEDGGLFLPPDDCVKSWELYKRIPKAQNPQPEEPLVTLNLTRRELAILSIAMEDLKAKTDETYRVKWKIEDLLKGNPNGTTATS